MQNYCKDSTNAQSVGCACVNFEALGPKGFCFAPNCAGQAYRLSTQIDKLCEGTSCVQYISGQGSDYYQKAKQVMCCDSSTGKFANRSGAKCEVVPSGGKGGNKPKTDTTILGVFGASSSSSLSCCFLLILLFLIYYLLY